MAKLTDLGLKNEKLDTGADSFADLPEQIGGAFPDPPQPGAFRFRMPSAEALANCFADKPIDTERGQRIAAQLRGDAALTIIQSPAGKYNGETFETRISNAERKRGKGEGMASDMDYLLAACGAEKKPKTNAEYGQALISLAGREFGGDVEWQWFCNEKKPIRVEQDGEFKTLDGSDGGDVQNGCGARYYQKDVPKDADPVTGERHFPIRIECGGKDGNGCGASLRAYAQIARFRK